MYETPENERLWRQLTNQGVSTSQTVMKKTTRQMAQEMGVPQASLTLDPMEELLFAECPYDDKLSALGEM